MGTVPLRVIALRRANTNPQRALRRGVRAFLSAKLAFRWQGSPAVLIIASTVSEWKND